MCGWFFSIFIIYRIERSPRALETRLQSSAPVAGNNMLKVPLANSFPAVRIIYRCCECLVRNQISRGPLEAALPKFILPRCCCNAIIIAGLVNKISPHESKLPRSFTYASTLFPRFLEASINNACSQRITKPKA